MDGYSVEEAAEVLGIPQGRVWELIARGVLSGVSEGRTDMRVFLRPPAGSPATPGGAGAPGRSDPIGTGDPALGANGGGAHVESSPFRELLTEFRNLTERYGQALLALGEARGEVASLRSRVDLLEARMDMRLPLRAASTVAWELPDRYAEQRPAAHDAESPAEATEPGAADAPPALEPVAEPAFAAGAESFADSSREDEPEPDIPEPIEEASETIAEAAIPPEAVEPGPLAEPDEQAETPGPGVEVVIHAPVAQAPRPPTTEAPKRRVTGGRAAIAGLAEALARAEDPALADLPGAREAAEALAALQRDVKPPEPEPAPAEAEAAFQAEAEPESRAAEPEADVPAAPVAEPVTEDIQAAFAPPIDAAEEAARVPEPAAEELIVAGEEGAAAESVGEGEEPESPQRADDGPSSPYTTEVVEPDWFADGDFSWLDATQASAEPSGDEQPAPDEPALDEPAPDEPAPDEPAPDEPAPDEPVPDEATSEREHVAEASEAPSIDAIQEAFDERGFDEGPAPLHDEAEAAAIQEAFDEPDAAHAAATAEAWPEEDRHSITGADAVGFNLFRTPGQAPVDAAPSRGAEPPSAEEELLWFGDEFEAGDLEVATPGWRAGDRRPTPPPAATVAPEREPLFDAAISDEEIDRLASDEGWNEAEIDAIRAYLGRSETSVLPTPAPDHQGQEPSARPPGTTEPAAHEPDPEEPGAGASSASLDQDWLRGRRGTAATAYRRLRRLFQG